MYFLRKLISFYLSSYMILLIKNASGIPLESNLRIAIVGGGIGGTSCAYFLNELLGKYNVSLDVYEANNVGGRLSVIKMNDQFFENGGSIIHPRNQYMKNFVSTLGLKIEPAVTLNKVGLYDGKHFQFVESSSGTVTFLKMLWRYGTDLFKLNGYINSLLDNFDNIYNLQKNYKYFVTVVDLLSSMNSEIPAYLTKSVTDAFENEMKYNERLVNELVFAANRVNYGQTNLIHQFVGSVSVAGAMNGLWAVEGGNYQVAVKLLESSKANLISKRVETVEFNKDSEKFMVVNNDNVSREYDILILAAPITNDAVLPIKFVNFPKKFGVSGSYHHTISTFVEGLLNCEYFGYSGSEDVPESIFSLKKDIFFNSISLLKSNGKHSIYKIFSQKVLTDEQLNMLFKEKYSVKITDWTAYPEYQTLPRNDSFILFNNLYYINAIEWAASAMEMSVIGAKNVALIVYNNMINNEIHKRINADIMNDEL